MAPVSLLRTVLAVVLVVLLSIAFPNAATHAVSAAPQANAVRISQVYGGGGSISSTYKCDFIELFNTGSSPVSLSGWSIQYAFVSSAFSDLVSLYVEIGAHSYVLVRGACGTYGLTVPTPVVLAPGLGMDPTSGKVALVSNSDPITGKSDSNVVDFVGYGTADEYEGSGRAPALSATTAAFRAGGGCTDTDDNAADFTAGTPAPRNSASATHICAVEAAPAVSGVLPTDGATDVALDANVVVTFSEPVTVANGWFSLACDLGGPVAATVTGGPTAWTLDPAADFLPDDQCQLTIVAAQVSDTDTVDPPNNMTANFVSSFRTVAGQCEDPATPIHAVQGQGAASAFAGSVRTVEGVVVGDFSGATRLNGLVVQEDPAQIDADALTSEGLFVADAAGLLVAASPGDRVRVTGTVAELDGTTTLTGLTQALTCPSGTLPAAAPVTLPLVSAADWERYEGMLVSFSQDLTVIDNAALGVTGSLTLVAGERPLAYTQSNAPSTVDFPAYEEELSRRTVVLDDGSAVMHPDPILYPPPGGLSASNTIRAGDVIAGLTGVVDERHGAYRIQPTQDVAVTATNARPAVPQFTGANVCVAFVSLDYFFTTISTDPDIAPGANNYEEYGRQIAKLVSLLSGLNCDVIGLSKLENNGYSPGSAIVNLVQALNAATADGAYAWIAAPSLLWGNGATSVGLIYRTAAVTPVGGTVGLAKDAFSQTASPVLHRQPMAQTFETVPWGERFTVVVNDWHGRDACPDSGADGDQGDGQACWNAARTAAAGDLAAWLATDPTASHDPDILILGELNAFAKETPVVALETAGYVNVVPATAYTVVSAGRAGAIDHALVTPGLAAQVIGAAAWAVNADEPAVLDYNTEDKTGGQLTSLYASDAYRASDHDPLIVGLTMLPDVSTLGGGYGTAWHTGRGEVRLGAEWSDEDDGDSDANDGVVRVEGSWNDGEGSVSVTVTADDEAYSCLDAWLDFGDGVAAAGTVETPNSAWDTNEHVIAGLPLGPGALQLVTFALPPGIINPSAVYNMRFRLTPAPDPTVGECTSATAAAIAAAPQPTGRADGGEVEDYTFEPGPLAVTLAAFAAAPAGEAIVVTWGTVSEVNNLGFHLYRGGTAAGPWTRLNAALIPSQAPGSSQGHAYEWLDRDVESGRTYFYLLQDVGVDGASTLHGPVSTAAAGPTAVGLRSFAGSVRRGPGLPLALLALLAAGAWRARRRPGA